MHKYYIKYGNYFLNVLRAPACGAELCINHCESAEHGVKCSFIYVRLGMQVIVTSMEEFIGG